MGSLINLWLHFVREFCLCAMKKEIRFQRRVTICTKNSNELKNCAKLCCCFITRVGVSLRRGSYPRLRIVIKVHAIATLKDLADSVFFLPRFNFYIDFQIVVHNNFAHLKLYSYLTPVRLWHNWKTFLLNYYYNEHC